jgi:hypothetical protein
VLRKIGLLTLALAGCYEMPGSGGTEVDPGEAPPYVAGTGASAPYPAGPYGIAVGSVIEDYEFQGLPNSLVDADNLQTIRLSDFYNPTGADVFPPGSPYGEGQPKPKALLVNVGAVWCGPCNFEAKNIFPPRYAEFQPQGGEFLFALVDGPEPGVPAEEKHLEGWAKKYDLDYPCVLDPPYKLGALFESDGFPANTIIDTRTMAIKVALTASPPPSFWDEFAQVLEGD